MSRIPPWVRRQFDVRRALRRRSSVLRITSFPKQLWKVLNAPIVIWFLTIAVVGFVGWAYTSIQSCRVEATNVSNQYMKIGQEIAKRYELLYDAAVIAQTADEFRKNDVVRNWNSDAIYSEFKGMSMAELLDEADKLSIKSNIVPDLGYEFSDQELKRTIDRMLQHNLTQRRDFSVDSGYMNVSKLRDADLQDLRADLQWSLITAANHQAGILKIGTVPIPVCGLWDIFWRGLTGEPVYYVRFVPFSSLFPSSHKSSAHNPH